VLDPEVVGEGGRRFVLRETGFEDMTGTQRAVLDHCDAAADVIAARIGGAS